MRQPRVAERPAAQAFALKGIRVNAVGPAPVSPNFPQGEAGLAREVRGLPLARAISPTNAAGAVLYLATSRNVTGQMIAVDAGQHLAWRTADVGAECARSGCGLANVFKRIGYEFQHHNALEDAKAAGQVLLAAMAESGLDLEGVLRRVGQPIDPTSASDGSAISARVTRMAPYSET